MMDDLWCHGMTHACYVASWRGLAGTVNVVGRMGRVASGGMSCVGARTVRGSDESYGRLAVGSPTTNEEVLKGRSTKSCMSRTTDRPFDTYRVLFWLQGMGMDGLFVL